MAGGLSPHAEVSLRTVSEDATRRRATLGAFDRALGREAHNLLQRPQLCWQQLHNRLQWGDEPVRELLEHERRRRSAGAPLWLRTKTRFRESDALLRDLEGHTEAKRTLLGHAGVTDCAFSPDGERVCSASDDRTLKTWDPESGTELSTLEGHSGGVNACAFSPDGSLICSASDDRTLKLWDGEGATSLATLPLLGDRISVALHPRLPLAACGDSGGGVYVVELVGIEYGPIIVTAVDLGSGPAVRCPCCLLFLPPQESWLGQEIICPEDGCATRMRVNPFVVERAR